MEDQRGVAVSTNNSTTRGIYENALTALNGYRGAPVAIIGTALAENPDFVIKRILRAHVHITLWERSIAGELEASLERLDGPTPYFSINRTRIPSSGKGRGMANCAFDCFAFPYPRLSSAPWIVGKFGTHRQSILTAAELKSREISARARFISARLSRPGNALIASDKARSPPSSIPAAAASVRNFAKCNL